MTPLLQMTQIGKSFAGHCVLQGVDLEVRAGEVHLLAGENGAGKSTLMKILAGVHTQYEGEIAIDGKRVRFSSTQDAARHGVSVIHQELSLIPWLSVMDNIFLGRERSSLGQWMRFREQENECRRLLEQLGLDVDPWRPVGEYPLSLQQMIEIAKALSIEARILVMDEPTSALTEPEAQGLFAIIEELRRRGCGIIYISHKMEEIYRIADRITVLRDGRSVGTEDATDLPRPKLVQWMVGRELDEQFPRHQGRCEGVRLRVEHFTLADPSGAPRNAVEDISFEVCSGEIVGIGGLQGSGASELLNALFGTYGTAGSGTVMLDGKAYRPTSPRHSISRGLALLTNDRRGTGLVPSLSVAQNVTLASLPRCSRVGWLQDRVERELARRSRERLGIRCASLDQEVASLSGGNQQKVVLAKWLLTQPRVLFLDEPTRGVDIGAKHEIYELMNEWTREGIAIVLITSEMPELLAMSDRILVMHRGRITAEMTAAEASSERVLNAAMGVEAAHA